MIISTIPVDFLNGKKFKKNLIYLNLNYALKENNNVTNIDSKLWLFLQAKKAFSLSYGFYPNIYYKKIEEIKPKSISLIGFMGTGKTTLGKKLSDKLDLDFIDLDSLIERKALRTIPSLFKEGEAFFRKIESKVLLDIDLKKPKIIACGGGTIIKKENLSFLKKQTQVTFLYSELKDIKERVGTTSSRPLYSKIDKIYKERSLEYLRACDICFINKDFKKTLENLTYEFKSTRQ
jgi:shikimate kinase